MRDPSLQVPSLRIAVSVLSPARRSSYLDVSVCALARLVQQRLAPALRVERRHADAERGGTILQMAAREKVAHVNKPPADRIAAGR